MIIRLLLITSLLGGCAYVPGPNELPEYETYNIQVNVHKDFESVNKAYGKEQKVWGFARWVENQGSIHYVHNDWETFIHEIKHVYYGNWHKDKQN